MEALDLIYTLYCVVVMTSKGKDKAIIQDEDNGVEMHERSLESVIEKYEMAMKDWKILRLLCR